MLREYFRSLVKRLGDFRDVKMYDRMLRDEKEAENGDLRVSYMTVLVRLGEYKKAIAQADILKAMKYNGPRIEEFTKTLKVLEERKNHNLLKGIVTTGLFFLCASSTFAEGDTVEKKESLVDKITGTQIAYAMPALPAPQQFPLAQEVIKQFTADKKMFLGYVNSKDISSKYKEKEISREDFEKVPVYRAYYSVNDKKEQLEEKITEPINKSKWKENMNIDKISAKFSNGDAKFQVRFREHQKKQKLFWIKADYEEKKVEATFALKF